MNRDQILKTSWEMRIGQCLKITARDFYNAFPKNPYPVGDQRPPIDQFLEKMPGANWGCYTCVYDILNNEFTICRHKEQQKQVRQDWDRRDA